MNKTHRMIERIAKFVAAVILLQTLYFKFGGRPESIYIFTKVGLEPWGRYLSGMVELIASVLILIPSKAWLGAFIALGVIGGAIISHLTTLGIVVLNDGGMLFMMACVVFICCLVVLYYNKKQIPIIGNYFNK